MVNYKFQNHFFEIKSIIYFILSVIKLLYILIF